MHQAVGRAPECPSYFGINPEPVAALDQECGLTRRAQDLSAIQMDFRRQFLAIAVLAGACRPATHPEPSRAQQEVADRLEDAARLLKDVGKKVPASVASRAVCAVILPA